MFVSSLVTFNLAGLCDLPSDLGRSLSAGEISHILEVCGALWLHDGDAHRPHAELTSGKCSDGFVNVQQALCHTPIAEILADQLMLKVSDVYHGPVDWVAGSDHAAATLSYSVAVRNRARHDFTEKGDGKSQKWSRFKIGPGEAVLQVEELITTLLTMEAVRKGIRAAHEWNITFTPVVGVLVNRSSAQEFEGSPIVSLATYDIKTWEPSDCPLCAAGSKRVRPKANWVELTGRAT